MLRARPELSILVVWTDNHMSILSNTEDLTIGLSVSPGCVDGELNRVITALFIIDAHVR